MLVPHDKTKNGVVIEIKQVKKQQENEADINFAKRINKQAKRINKQIEIAKTQINQNKYYKELIDNKIPKENIIKIPVIFAGKEPFITGIKID